MAVKQCMLNNKQDIIPSYDYASHDIDYQADIIRLIILTFNTLISEECFVSWRLQLKAIIAKGIWHCI